MTKTAVERREKGILTDAISIAPKNGNAQMGNIPLHLG
jgi:hypothetical protein